MGAVAFAVDHAADGLVLNLLGQAALGVAVAGAGPAHSHVVDGVVIFLLQKNVRYRNLDNFESEE